MYVPVPWKLRGSFGGGGVFAAVAADGVATATTTSAHTNHQAFIRIAPPSKWRHPTGGRVIGRSNPHR